jgi:hypothetical protein
MMACRSQAGKGTSASQGNFRADQDPFVAKALRRAFETCQQPQVPKYRSDPLALAPENRPAFVVAVPLRDVNENFTGMLAAVVSLDSILHRLQEASVRGRAVFLWKQQGIIVIGIRKISSLAMPRVTRRSRKVREKANCANMTVRFSKHKTPGEISQRSTLRTELGGHPGVV